MKTVFVYNLMLQLEMPGDKEPEGFVKDQLDAINRRLAALPSVPYLQFDPDMDPENDITVDGVALVDAEEEA